ncbi:hypothetical protein [Priestia megaterium]|nr:hypothetical protein [Priestia megaterium]MEC1068549.1 hypothetical protein [Priestia megaterium]
MIGEQGEDSCGNSGRDETPQKAKPCTEIHSGVINDRYELLSSICLFLD